MSLVFSMKDNVRGPNASSCLHPFNTSLKAAHTDDKVINLHMLSLVEVLNRMRYLASFQTLKLSQRNDAIFLRC